MKNIIEINRWLKQTHTELKESFAVKLKNLATEYKKTH